MNWLTGWKKKIGIKVKKIFKKQPVGQQETDWKNCPQCKKISYLPDLIANSYICECSFHFDLPPKLRLDSLFDSNYEIIEASRAVDPDPLKFSVKDGAREGYKYIDKIKKYREITKQHTALLCASGTISNLSAVVVCFNPKFGGGRFGPAENEHFLMAANIAIQKKVDVWIVVYQSSGIDVHSGITALAGMTKSVVAMNEIKKAGIPTFAVAARAVAGGTLASSYYLHDFLIIENKLVENILFSGRRVTQNILKDADAIPEDYGRGDGIMKAGLADIVLESRKELKDIVVRLSSIILKKELLDKKDSTSDISEEQIPTSLQKTSEAI
jgi:acetyl-CoA carboxylase carboxyl transferase subunit beta